MLERLREIICDTDISIMTFVIGLAIISMGVLVEIPAHFILTASAHIWVLNHILLGIGFLVCSFKKNPPGLSLVVGAYSCIMWMWLIGINSIAVYPTVFVFNAIIVAVGVLLIQRSGTQK